MRSLYGLLALSGLIVLHELGHALAARLFGVDVRKISLGLGPPLLSFRRGGTIYNLLAVPLGGSVHIRGMNPHEGREEDARSFQTKAPWKRVAMLLAGSVANFALALGVFTALYTFGTHVPVPMTVGIVDPGSEGARALLRPGDRLTSLDGKDLTRWSILVAEVSARPFERLRLGVERGQSRRVVEVTPRPDARGVGRLGLHQQYTYRTHRPTEAVRLAFGHLSHFSRQGFTVLVDLVRGGAGLRPRSPTAVFRRVSEVASTGLDAFLRVFGGVSFALAVFYLLPLPALDGGRALFVAFEALTRKRVNPKFETFLHFVGFFALMALILLVIVSEIRQARG